MAGVKLTRDERARIAKLVDEIGAQATADALSVYLSTMCKAVGGLPLRPSTAVCIRAQLAALRVPPETLEQ